jgi:GNAT superfamily N-acetyltransferase
MQIRFVHENELPELLALLRAKAEFDGNIQTFVATIDSLRAALFSDSPMAKAIVAVEDGVVIGMATFYASFSSFIAKPCIWLDDLYVYEGHRSKGVGRSLVKRLSALAHEQGCGRIDWVVAAHNNQGKEFYSRLGATIFDSIRLARLDESAIHVLAHEDA